MVGADVPLIEGWEHATPPPSPSWVRVADGSKLGGQRIKMTVCEGEWFVTQGWSVFISGTPGPTVPFTKQNIAERRDDEINCNVK